MFINIQSIIFTKKVLSIIYEMARSTFTIILSSLSQTRIMALLFRQNLSQTGIPALPFCHNFVSYISITTQPYVVVLQLHKCVRLALNFGRKTLDHRFCSKVFSLDIYIVKVSHYFKYYKKVR